MVKASRILGFKLEIARNAKRIGVEEKDKRDLLIYLLWRIAGISNKEIGTLFGLSYSAISRRVKIIRDRISIEPQLEKDFQTLKSQIRFDPNPRPEMAG